MRAALTKRVTVLTALSLLSLACGGGNGGDASTSSTDSRTTIEGRVTGVATATAPGSGIGAQASQVSGIRVEAQRGGQILDVATTNAEGRFTLDFVGGGTIELVFVTDEAVLRLEVNALPGSVITLVVHLHIVEQEVVVIDDTLLESGPIRCESGRFSVFDEALDLVIDGHGDDCLRAENDCVVDIAVRSLTLVGCERCIDAHSNAEVVVTTSPGGVTCEAREDGIRAQSSSFVAVDGFDDIDIIAGDNGIRAESNAEVVLVSGGTCFIEASDDPIRTESQAIIDLNGCRDVVFVGVVDDADADDDDFDDGDSDDDDFDDDD